MTRTHYIAGSGEHGCLYDYCAPCQTLAIAVDSLQGVFDLGRNRTRELKRDRYLSLNPQRDGASYCEITECDCDEPWQHEEYADQLTRDEWADWMQELDETPARPVTSDTLSNVVVVQDDGHGYSHQQGETTIVLSPYEEYLREESEIRRAEMQSVRWLVDLARSAGVLRIILNGSFVTDALDPNDVDCVLLVGTDFPRDKGAAEELDAGLPFLEIDLVDPSVFHRMTTNFFATDRHQIPKGMIEVIP